jgi:hypothetical protein
MNEQKADEQHDRSGGVKPDLGIKESIFAERHCARKSFQGKPNELRQLSDDPVQ